MAERAEQRDPIDSIMDVFGSVEDAVAEAYEKLSKLDPAQTLKDITEPIRPFVESVKQKIEDITQ